MAQNSKIEWTHHTANLWHGCTKVHEGCDNCYAETLSHRWGNDLWGNDKPRKMIASVWDDLAKYQKLAKAADQVHRVFVGSMMDIFEKPMPLVDNKGNHVYKIDCGIKTTGDLRKSLFNQIDIGRYPNLMFLLLTKRPSNINKYIPESWKESPPENVMFGTSPVNQETAKTLINQLMQVKGKRFLSVEPQLGQVTLMHKILQVNDNGLWLIKKEKMAMMQEDFAMLGIQEPEQRIHWVIQGGESGHYRRPFNLEWAYSLKAECEEAGVPYFFKQIDKVLPIPEDLQVRQFPRNKFPVYK